ncbi:maternal embryonic leucine zipper kinase-like [Xenia sp. Carnegie-2017]|uniref:maternal embryonic leucine zipper kinase-like n=1 Tax=Xenia sp. Carnegie-2017 TaxID=2897299 RepID=UPI001F04811C|nr:maternal embryonic leucine zipper kinase-like [Xenia sp. Carnegie-2017]
MPDAIYPDELSDIYDIKETIGSGGFAKVKLAVHRPTNEKVAIKMMTKRALAHDLPRVYTEIATMKELCHQNICQLYEVIETTDEIFLILEYAPGGELFDYIVAKDRLEEQEARHFLRQIVAALGYMHEKGYAHRDLKPENLLLDENQDIKLIDFGLVGKPEGGMSEKLETCCGSPAYAAPELISGVPYFGNEADLWSLGVLLYALLCGYLPFDDDDTYNLYKSIQKGQYDTPNFLSKGSVALIGQMLKTDPKQRLTVQKLCVHPWLNKGYANPVHFKTRVKKEEPDVDVIKELALFYGVSPLTLTSLVKEYKFDDLTSAYFLLCKKKSRGESLKLFHTSSKVLRNKRKEMLALEKKLSETVENNEDESFSSDLPSLLVDDEDDVFPDDLLDFRKPRACTLPLEFIISVNEEPSNSDLSSNGLLKPSVPSKEHIVPSSISNYEFGSVKPLSPETKLWSQSLDNNLDRSPWTNSTPRQQSKSASSRRFSEKTTGLFGSIEGGINRFFGAFTPRRSASSHPRKVKALYNVSTTTSKGAQEVVEALQNVLEKRNGLMYKLSGFTIRCKTMDDRGKVILDFELEVCEIQKIEMIGVRRKRLKGDTWAYKKICEEIFNDADL